MKHRPLDPVRNPDLAAADKAMYTEKSRRRGMRSGDTG